MSILSTKTGTEAGNHGGHLGSNAQLGSLKRQSRKQDGAGISRPVGRNHENAKGICLHGSDTRTPDDFRTEKC